MTAWISDSDIEAIYQETPAQQLVEAGFLCGTVWGCQHHFFLHEQMCSYCERAWVAYKITWEQDSKLNQWKALQVGRKSGAQKRRAILIEWRNTYPEKAREYRRPKTATPKMKEEILRAEKAEAMRDYVSTNLPHLFDPTLSDSQVSKLATKLITKQKRRDANYKKSKHSNRKDTIVSQWRLQNPEEAKKYIVPEGATTKESKAIRQAEYRVANPEKFKKYTEKYQNKPETLARKNNPKVKANKKALDKAYRLSHPEEFKGYTKKYQSKPEVKARKNTPKAKAIKKANMDAYRKAHPEIMSMHARAYRAKKHTTEIGEDLSEMMILHVHGTCCHICGGGG